MIKIGSTVVYIPTGELLTYLGTDEINMRSDILILVDTTGKLKEINISERNRFLIKNIVNLLGKIVPGKTVDYLKKNGGLNETQRNLILGKKIDKNFLPDVNLLKYLISIEEYNIKQQKILNEKIDTIKKIFDIYCSGKPITNVQKTYLMDITNNIAMFEKKIFDKIIESSVDIRFGIINKHIFCDTGKKKNLLKWHYTSLTIDHLK